LPTDFPLLKGKTWKAQVDIDTGRIMGWPAGEEREMFVKVCDAGVYTLLDSDWNTVAVKDGYVPHGVVPGEYGDYVHLKINGEGVITNWPENPDVKEFFEDT
jgi:hypothetical protein